MSDKPTVLNQLRYLDVLDVLSKHLAGGVHVDAAAVMRAQAALSRHWYSPPPFPAGPSRSWDFRPGPIRAAADALTITAGTGVCFAPPVEPTHPPAHENVGKALDTLFDVDSTPRMGWPQGRQADD